jgi:hypothetical protein
MKKLVGIIRVILIVVFLSSLILLSMPGCQQTATTGITQTSVSSTEGTTTQPAGTTGTRPTRPTETILNMNLNGKSVLVPTILFVSQLGYSMYYDNALYRVSQADSYFRPGTVADVYLPVTSLDQMPDVYLEIGHLANTDVKAALTDFMDLLKPNYQFVNQAGPIGIGVDKIDALVIDAGNGADSYSALANIAIISDGKSGVYYFMDAYYRILLEGHKSRMDQLIDTFRIE